MQGDKATLLYTLISLSNLATSLEGVKGRLKHGRDTWVVGTLLDGTINETLLEFRSTRRAAGARRAMVSKLLPDLVLNSHVHAIY